MSIVSLTIIILFVRAYWGDNRGSSAFGIMNLLSKNILTGFINSVGRTLGIPDIVLGFVMSLVAVTILILFIRAYWGSDRT